jgi:phosphoserine aminotransferase
MMDCGKSAKIDLFSPEPRESLMRVFNFSAGPAVLPEPVLSQAAEEMLDWRGSGMSVMEMSHRGKEFIGIAAKAEADLRSLLAIPADYSVLFLQGGAIAENAIVPMNLLGRKTAADSIAIHRNRGGSRTGHAAARPLGDQLVATRVQRTATDRYGYRIGRQNHAARTRDDQRRTAHAAV